MKFVCRVMIFVQLFYDMITFFFWLQKVQVGSAPVTTRVRARLRAQGALTDHPPTLPSHRQRESNTQPSARKWSVPYQLSQRVLVVNYIYSITFLSLNSFLKKLEHNLTRSYLNFFYKKFRAQVNTILMMNIGNECLNTRDHIGLKLLNI